MHMIVSIFLLIGAIAILFVLGQFHRDAEAEDIA